MLQRIRERIQGWVAGVIIAIIAAAFLLFGLEYYIDRSSGGAATVAKVDGTAITQSEFTKLYQQVQRRQQQAQHGVPLSKEQSTQLKAFVLQQMVNKLAITRAAEKAGFAVSDQEVQQLVMSLPQLQKEGKFSPLLFQQLLYAYGFTQQQFYDQIRTQVLTSQVAMGLQKTAFVLPNELQTAYELFNQTRSFGYFILPQSMVMSSIKVTPAQVKAYYQKNAAQFQTPEQIQLKYILLSPATLAKQVDISDKELKAYYQGSISNYKIPARWHVQRLIVKLPENPSDDQIKAAHTEILKAEKALQSGKSMAQVAKSNNNVATAQQWISQAQANATLEGLLKSLKPKQFSTPFRTQDGVNVIEVLKTEPEKVRPFSEVKASLKENLLRQKIDKTLSEKSDQLSNLTYTNPTSLQPAAKAMGVKVQESSLLSKQGAKSGPLADPRVMAAAFTKDVLEQGNNSNPITLQNGDVIVLRVEKHIPSKAIPLANVQDKIKTAIQKQSSETELGVKAYQLQSQLQKGTDPAQIAHKYNLKWVFQGNVKRADKGINSEVLATAFSTPMNADKKAAVNSVQLANGDYAVILVKHISHADFSKTNTAERKALTQELSNVMGQIDYRFYGQSVIKNADIKIENKNVK